jgi:Flp pilus assembly protein TadG
MTGATRLAQTSRASNTSLLRMLESLWRDNVGSALVEGAVLMPVLLIVLGGVYEFSWIFFQQKQIEAGVRDAARYLSRLQFDPYTFDATTNPCTLTDSGGNLYKTYAQNIAVYGSPSTTGFSPRVNGWTPGAVTITCPTFINSSLFYVGPPTLYRVLVSTSFPDPSLGFLGILGLSAPNISASHQELFVGG